jgi:sulfatase maturation enzyme AslB (radical SAM superfamily)
MAEKLFCYAPWTNLEILPSGDILPCCKFLPSTGQENFNIVQHTIQDYRSSQLLIDVKQEFNQGRWPKGCNRCQIEESSGIKSKRILDHERWKQHYDLYNLEDNHILTVSMALGNTCNLKCIICGPVASSKWQKEYFDIYNIKVESIESVRKSVISGITDIAPNLVHIDIHGGEPFLSGIAEHRTFLDHYIDNKSASQVSIHYTTNGTVWPEQEWFDRWQHFKEVDLQISIDGIRERYEYLRYPANWDALESNVKKYVDYEKTQPNFRLSVAHTVSAYNIFYLEEFINWCADIKLPKPWIGKLHRPDILRPTVWNKHAKIFITKYLESSHNEEVKKWAHHLNSIDDSTLFDMFVERTNTHDQYRKLDFKKTFPELAPYI